MRTWTRTAGLLFLAASAVYNGKAIAAGLGKAGSPDTSTAAPRAADRAAAPAKDSTADLKDSTDSSNPFKDTATSSSKDAKDAKDASPTTAPTTAPSTGKSVSASEVAVSKDSGTVEIHVNDANIVEVLRMLSMQSNTNILPSKEVRGTVTANLYDVTIKEALDAILKANGYGYREKGNVIYVLSAKEIAEQEKGDRKMNTEVFHLYYTPAANAQTMIKPLMSSEGQVAVTTPAIVGIDASAKDTGGNTHAVEDMMVITDYPENLDRVRKILKEIDRRPQQILVEATILRASLSEDNALGIDFALLGGVDFHALTAAGSNLGEVLSGNIVNNATAGTVAHQGVGGASTGFTSGVPTGGLRIGITTSNVQVFLQALEEVTNTVVMANPKVLVLNKQKGEVKVARLDPFRGQTTIGQGGVSQQTIDFLETGTLLMFRPFIGDDGFVRMEVHPEDSTPLASRASDLPPTKLTTETTTNIMVKDGHTVVIGGLFRDTSQTSRQQVPILGNIPILGNLFRNKKDTTQREEVIILLTPHVIKDDAVYSKASEEQLKEAERLRVGVRRGMMPFGRERLAECCYEKAVHELNKANPDRHKVLWHLDCATNLNPTFTEAIDLKAKVTGKEVTTADNSSIRNFVRQQIMLDKGTAAAPATHPAVAGGSTAQPTTQPAQANGPATQPSKPSETVDVYGDEYISDEAKKDEKMDPAATAAKPATQPSTQPSVAKTDSAKKADKPAEDVSITVLPLEDLKDGEKEPAPKEEVKEDSEKSEK